MTPHPYTGTLLEQPLRQCTRRVIVSSVSQLATLLPLAQLSTAACFAPHLQLSAGHVAYMQTYTSVLVLAEHHSQARHIVAANQLSRAAGACSSRLQPQMAAAPPCPVPALTCTAYPNG
jgi:hypothetical protein